VSVDVVVIDNASGDGSADGSEALGARLIRNDTNHGLSLAWNQGQLRTYDGQVEEDRVGRTYDAIVRTVLDLLESEGMTPFQLRTVPARCGRPPTSRVLRKPLVAGEPEPAMLNTATLRLELLRR
jgi:glycosyltransferase involved in cell wall biosynthesis